MADDTSQPNVLALLDLISTNLVSFQERTEANFAVMRADFNGMRGELVRVRDDVGDLKSDVSVLKSDVAVLKSDVKEIRETMTAGFSRIEKRLDLIEAS